MCNSSKLKSIYLAGNKIREPLPACLWSLSNLEDLSLSSNGIGDEMPPISKNMTNLRLIELDQVAPIRPCDPPLLTRSN